MRQTIVREGKYEFGNCFCCGKRFTRTTRGLPVGLGVDDKIYTPAFPHLDTDKEITFDTPVTIKEVVKLGVSCYRKKFEN